MRPISQVKALRSWLRMERHRPEAVRASDRDSAPDDLPPLESMSERAMLDELLDRKPGAAGFVWRDAPVEWYATRLDREAVERLRVVEGPPDLRWRALSPDGTVRGAADRIARGNPEELAAETGVDVPKVLRFRDDPPGGPLVVSTREGCVPRYVADGNHRAVALALRARSGEFDPPRAYLGVGANPVARPLFERLCGVVGDALGDWF